MSCPPHLVDLGVREGTRGPPDTSSCGPGRVVAVPREEVGVGTSGRSETSDPRLLAPTDGTKSL